MGLSVTNDRTVVRFVSGARLETVSLSRLWPGFRLVDTRNSVYGSLTVVETSGIRSLLENGLVMFHAC